MWKTLKGATPTFVFEECLNFWGVFEEFGLSPQEFDTMTVVLVRVLFIFLEYSVEAPQEFHQRSPGVLFVHQRVCVRTVLNSWGKIGSSRNKALQSESGGSLKNPSLILFIYDLRTDSGSYTSVALLTAKILFGECKQLFSLFWGVAQLLRK